MCSPIREKLIVRGNRDDDYRVCVASCMAWKICEKLSCLVAQELALFQVELEVDRKLLRSPKICQCPVDDWLTKDYQSS